MTAPLFDGTLLQHRAYTDPSVFEKEMELLFGKAWIYLGHDCQIPEPGDYFLGHVGRTSVIVVRDHDLQPRVLENRCAHRGPAVCLDGRGRTKMFTCPYHGWTYNLDGRLRSLPLPEDYNISAMKRDKKLKPAARVDRYRGFIFASFCEDGPDLREFLGSSRAAFDNFMDRAPDKSMEPLSVPLRHKLRANWKLVFENLNDTIHPLFAHGSVSSAGRASERREELGSTAQMLSQNPGRLLQGIRGVRTVTNKFGHSFQPGLAAFIGAERESREDHFAALAATKGEHEAEQILATDLYVSLVYPSVLVKPGSQSIRIIRPIAVDETEVTTLFFRLHGAPDSVTRAAQDYHNSLGSPASPVLSDDLFIYELIQADFARDYAMSFERGLLVESDSADDEGNGTSEVYIRQQYRAWSKYLAGSWP